MARRPGGRVGELVELFEEGLQRHAAGGAGTPAGVGNVWGLGTGGVTRIRGFAHRLQAGMPPASGVRAAVGDRFMSVIQTCRVNWVNPFEYMMALMRNAEAAKSDPEHWMPWNYQEQAAATEPLAS